jgi:hypothetical protein
MSEPRLPAEWMGRSTEDTVEKRTFLSEAYAVRASGREPLDRRYGEIGISAVAAAVRYQGEIKAAADAHADDADAHADDQVSAKSAA